MYRAVRCMVYIFLKLFNRWKIEGLENLPKTGPVVLVANHRSFWDPLYVGCSIPRVLRYMSKAELFQKPGFKWLLPKLGCFPVKRGQLDRNALRLAAHYLEQGEVLGLFPEGTRSHTSEMLPFQHGAALFALRSAAPILPVGLIGVKTSFPSTLRGNIRVVVGKPMSYPELYGTKIGDAQLQKVTQELQEAVAQLLQTPIRQG